MKKQKKQKLKFIWRDLALSNPYKVIEEIFNYATVQYYRDFLRDVLLYSTKSKEYRKEHVGHVIFSLEGIACLLKACFVISKEKKHSLLDVTEEDILNANFYSSRNSKMDLWSDFPRSLSQAEILDPYIAFGKIFECHNPDKWHEIMKDVVNYAGSTCYHDMLEENLLEVYLQLSKLFEAAHLIHVREINHVWNWRRHETS